MRIRALLLALLLIFLRLPATAQTATSLEAFATEFSAALQAEDWPTALHLIETHPQDATLLFEAAGLQHEEARKSGDSQTVLQYEILMNVLARAFQLRLGRDDLAAQLQARGLLLPDSAWVDSALEGTTTPPKVADGAPPTTGVLGEAMEIVKQAAEIEEEVPAEQDRLQFVLSVGDLPATFELMNHWRDDFLPRVYSFAERGKRLVEDLRKAGLVEQDQVDEVEASLKPLWEFQAIMQQGWTAVEVLQLSNLGLYSEAERKGEEALAKATNATAKEYLHTALVNVGFFGGRPDLVRTHVKALAPTEASASFPISAVRFDDEFRQDPNMSVETYLKRHDEAVKLLDTVEQSDFDAEVGYGVRIWIMAAADLAARLDPKDPRRAQIQKVIDTDIAWLAEEADRAWKVPVLVEGRLNPDWNPRLMFTLLDLHLDLAQHARENGDSKTAAAELRDAESRLPMLRAAVPELEAARTKLFADSKLECDVLRGHLSQLPARVLEEKGRQAGLGTARSSFEEALKLYERAAAIQPRLLLLPDYALSVDAAGDHARALQVAEQAVQEAQRAGQRVALAQALMARGRIKATGPGAIEDLQKGTAMLETVLTELGGSSSVARRMRLVASPAYDHLARLQTEAGQAEEAFATLARKQQVEGFGATTPSNERTAEIQAMRSRLGGLEEERLALSSLPETAEVKVLKARNSELLAETRSDFYARLGDLYRDEPAYQRLAIRPVVYGQIQALLPTDTVVLQYLPSEKQTYIFVLTREAMRVRRVDVTEAELKAGVQEFRSRMAGYTAALENGTAARSWADDGSEAWKKQVLPLRALLVKMHGLLIDPVEEDLKGKDVVAVIPTGDLMYLPFSALARPNAEADDVEFFAERKQVVNLVKASDLLQVNVAERGTPGPVMAFGDPDGSLKAAQQEVNALQKVFPDARVFVGRQASYDQLRGIVGEVGYLHLATHGVLDSTPAQNHLVLAGLPEDRLTMADIADLQLGPSTRVVTLSGCQTALNSPNPETELLQSVADAFSFAGSPAVVASLWRVADESTRDLMVEFYRELKGGKSLARSLQTAEKALLKDPARRHPFYWAPFVLIGDWR